MRLKPAQMLVERFVAVLEFVGIDLLSPNCADEPPFRSVGWKCFVELPTCGSPSDHPKTRSPSACPICHLHSPNFFALLRRQPSATLKMSDAVCEPSHPQGGDILAA